MPIGSAEILNSLQAKDESLDESRFFRIYYDFSETVELCKATAIGSQSGETLVSLKIRFEHATDRILAFFGNVKVRKCLLIAPAIRYRFLAQHERRIRQN